MGALPSLRQYTLSSIKCQTCDSHDPMMFQNDKHVIDSTGRWTIRPSRTTKRTMHVYGHTGSDITSFERQIGRTGLLLFDARFQGHLIRVKKKKEEMVPG